MRKMPAYEQQARIMKALAHPVRLRILDILQQEECVCHLTAVLDAQQPYVSKQLAILREAGLVADRRDGLMVYYRVQDERVMDAVRSVRAVCVAQSGATWDRSPVPEPPVDNCPCPRCEAERRSNHVDI